MKYKFETFWDGGKRRTWTNDQGQRHRDPKDGPAIENFHPSGGVWFRSFWVNGQRHRDPKDGPADEYLRPDGSVSSREFCVNGKRLSDAEVQAILNPPKPCEPCKELEINGKIYVLKE